ncbi:hypothetical protein BDM02DRAFT_2236310 [Thelephora ganbajun]|uniref:Uncharacterized protein n=1 Tax=Thelephora ganbajun TaxID=370292 RepID=A0ACB6ZG78_THEGA|nr:hypothetical protein BDM02DRAFT_2236310 [Thelephora ganbajun]
MTTALNEDIFTLIYSHVFDFEVLRTAATAIATTNQHPLRNVILHRLLQLPLRLSSENLDDSKALIDHFVRTVTHADLVQDIAIVLGPSRKTIAEHERFGEEALPEHLEQAERAEALVESLPDLLRLTENLQRLDWSRSPPPSREILKELSEHSLITSLSLDCSVDSHFFPDPSRPLEVPDTTAKRRRFQGYQRRFLPLGKRPRPETRSHLRSLGLGR